MLKYVLIILLFWVQPLQAAQNSDQPLRVIALAPNLLELVYALGAENLLVGRSQFATYPIEAQDLPSVGSYYRPDLEKIVALQPNLCLAITDGTPAKVLERLEQMGITVFRSNPKNFEELQELILHLGQLLNRTAKAQQLVTKLQTRLQDLDFQVKLALQTTKKPSVLFQLQSKPIIVVGQNNFINDLITQAGGINVVQGIGYPRLSPEEVLLLQPDIILAVGMTGPNQESLQIVQEWAKYELPATQQDRVYELNPDIFNRISLRSVEALQQLVTLFFGKSDAPN